MAHELELDRQGRASFCYNHRNGNPWHKLGFSFDRAMTLDEAIHACRADRLAEKCALYGRTNEGFLKFGDKMGVVFPDLDGKLKMIGVVGKDYPVVQYRSITELAMAVVGASADEAVLDTLGVLFDGAKFFGFIDFGDVTTVLPSGAVDRFYRGLGFMSDHTGGQSITFWKSRTRAVCNNTVETGISRAGAGEIVRIRHTGDAGERMSQVPRLLGLAHGGDEAFEALVQQLGSIEARGTVLLDKVIRAIWPKPEEADATDRAKKIWDNRFDRIEDLYYNPANAGGYGLNGWSVYNAVGEFLDHRQGTNIEARAFKSIDPSSTTSAKKHVAVQRILASVA